MVKFYLTKIFIYAIVKYYMDIYNVTSFVSSFSAILVVVTNHGGTKMSKTDSLSEFGQVLCEFVDREMMLIKVNAKTALRSEVLRIADIFRGKIVDVGPETYTVEITGDEGKLNAIIDLLKPIGIKEIVRTGKVAITRGSRILSTL